MVSGRGQSGSRDASRMTSPLRTVVAFLPLAAFIALALVAVSLRAFIGLHPYQEVGLGFMAAAIDGMEQNARLDGVPPVGLRVGAAWIYKMVEAVFWGFAEFFELTPDVSLLHQSRPDETRRASPEMISGAVAPLLAIYVTSLLLLLPVYGALKDFFAPVAARLAMVVVVMCALGGWPAFVMEAFFAIVRTTVDWPHSYYLFSTLILLADVAAAAFLFLIAFFFSRGMSARPLSVAALAATGQLFFENLGFVVGVAALIHQALGNEEFRVRLKRGFVSFVSAGAAAAPVCLVLVLLLLKTGTPTLAGSGISAIETYLLEKWIVQGHYNFAWFNVTVANFISVMIMPCLFGGLIGLLMALGRGASEPELLRETAIVKSLLAVALAFFLSMGIGLFISGFGSDMGRQALPLAMLAGPLAAKAAEVAVRLRRGGQGSWRGVRARGGSPSS